MSKGGEGGGVQPRAKARGPQREIRSRGFLGADKETDKQATLKGKGTPNKTV